MNGGKAQDEPGLKATTTAVPGPYAGSVSPNQRIPSKSRRPAVRPELGYLECRAATESFPNTSIAFRKSIHETFARWLLVPRNRLHRLRKANERYLQRQDGPGGGQRTRAGQ